jgi:hypothetical protein
VGADRKGPLAAFVVIAVIAGILLVTSVRSQAAPGWFDPSDLPATVVAAPPVDSGVWGSATSGLEQFVEQGAHLVHRATGPASAQDGDAAVAALTSSDSTVTPGQDAAPQVPPTQVPAHTGGHPHSHHVAPDRHHVAAVDDDPSTPTGTASHDHGRHLGWGHGHRHGNGHGHSGRDHGRHHGRHLGRSKHRS